MADGGFNGQVHAQFGDSAVVGMPGTGLLWWVTLLQADPGMADVLASVPDNTMPITEIGHGIDLEGHPGMVARIKAEVRPPKTQFLARHDDLH
jgi:hypothetical protein